MSLQTPEQIRTLQRKLYCKAKAEPAFRFYVLYDKICRDAILRHAYGLARAHAGAPGVDGVGFAEIEASGLEVWLADLREDLVSKTYRPDPVRRVLIPKPDGGERPLGIPTIRDRVVQTAAKRACRKLWRRPQDGLDRSSFQTLLTCGRPKQTASSRFCSHTVQVPAQPNPLRSYSMASKPWMVRRAVAND